MVAYLAGYMVNVVPIPGGIGVLDAGLVGALALYGLPLSQAAAAVLVYHAVAFWSVPLHALACSSASAVRRRSVLSTKVMTTPSTPASSSR